MSSGRRRAIKLWSIAIKDEPTGGAGQSRDLKAGTTKPRISMRPPVQARVAAGRQPVVVERRAPRILIR